MGLSDSRILSTVHDELIVWAPEADAESVRELVAATLREAMDADASRNGSEASQDLLRAPLSLEKIT
ncbi:MAG: hypothetical protein H7A53_10570 [Akkermansiaceae bacterium]|nr:hypothetical protein [Akkermansiaceae bacterium]